MTELTTILQLLLLSLWCHGWYYLFSPGEALYFLSKWAYKDYKKAEADREKGKQNISEWYNLNKKEEWFTVDELGTEVGKARNAAHKTHNDLLVDLYNEKLEENNINFERKVYFLKPLFLCPICFASIYGTGGYLLLNYTTWGIFPVAIISLISVNKIMQKFV